MKYSIKLEFKDVLDFDNDYGKKIICFLGLFDFVDGNYNKDCRKVYKANICERESIFVGTPVYFLNVRDDREREKIITRSIVLRNEYGRSFSGTIDGIKEHLQGEEFSLTNDDVKIVEELILNSKDKSLKCVFYNKSDFCWNYLSIKETE